MLDLRRAVPALSILALLVACSGGGGSTDGPTGTAGGAFSFNATADNAPAGAKVIVIWSVSSGSPDYSYAFGGGTAQGSQISVSFSATPPAEALNAGKLGVGIVALVDAATSVPEGKLPREQIGALLAAAPQHAVIFRNAGETVLENGWDTGFPQGFACGKCVDQPTGFDKFEVVDCSDVKLVPYSKDVKFCNWT